MAVEAIFGGEIDPANGSFRAVEDGEDAIFFLQDALNGRRGKGEEGLKFAEVQKTHNGVDVGAGKKNAGDREMGVFVGRGSEFGSREKLGAEIGRGSEEEPVFFIGSEGQLGLSSRVGVEASVAETGTILAGAIPLRETAAGCGT